MRIRCCMFILLAIWLCACSSPTALPQPNSVATQSPRPATPTSEPSATPVPHFSLPLDPTLSSEERQHLEDLTNQLEMFWDVWTTSGQLSPEDATKHDVKVEIFRDPIASTTMIAVQVKSHDEVYSFPWLAGKPVLDVVAENATTTDGLPLAPVILPTQIEDPDFGVLTLDWHNGTWVWRASNDALVQYLSDEGVRLHALAPPVFVEANGKVEGMDSLIPIRVGFGGDFLLEASSLLGAEITDLHQNPDQPQFWADLTADTWIRMCHAEYLVQHPEEATLSLGDYKRLVDAGDGRLTLYVFNPATTYAMEAIGKDYVELPAFPEDQIADESKPTMFLTTTYDPRDGLVYMQDWRNRGVTSYRRSPAGYSMIDPEGHLRIVSNYGSALEFDVAGNDPNIDVTTGFRLQGGMAGTMEGTISATANVLRAGELQGHIFWNLDRRPTGSLVSVLSDAGFNPTFTGGEPLLLPTFR